MNKQRHFYEALQEGKEAPLRGDQIVALTRLGFSFSFPNRRRKNMKDRIVEYVEFVKANNRFPIRHAKDELENILANSAIKWKQKRKLHLQKGITKANKLGNCVIPQEQVDALDNVDFDWSTRENVGSLGKIQVSVLWETRFEFLKAYTAKHGHCEPPKRHEKVGRWAFQQRMEYKRMVDGRQSSMTLERFRKLSELGFRFQVRGKELPRKRYVDDGSSGYDTSSSEDDEEGDNEQQQAVKKDNGML
jgi:hypothetical protein